MKINIGCGYNYLQGYVNVDSSPDSLADRLMEAHNLDFESDSALEIRASQLIEHLGYFKALYFLAECWRVLKPGRTLIIETPDIESTFATFLKGDRTAREAALGWVYGSETAGMGHVFCFPEELMAELLSAAGFELKSKERFVYQESRPAIRFTAVKKEGEVFAFAAALRRELAVSGAALFGDEYALAEQEKLIKICLSKAVMADDNLAFELALYQPEFASAFFKAGGGTGRFLKAADKLAAANFTAWMYGRLAGNKREGHKAAVDQALAEGRQVLKAVLAGGRAPQCKAGLCTIFSSGMARVLGERIFCRGLKAYGGKDMRTAAEYFERSALIFRDNPHSWLYLARCRKEMADHGGALSAYRAALGLFEKDPQANDLAKATRKEIGRQIL